MRERVQAKACLEVDLAGGTGPREVVETGRLLQGGDQQQGNHCLSNEHSMSMELGRRSTRCVASGKRALPFLRTWSLVLRKGPRKDGLPHPSVTWSRQIFTLESPCHALNVAVSSTASDFSEPYTQCTLS